MNKTYPIHTGQPQTHRNPPHIQAVAAGFLHRKTRSPTRFGRKLKAHGRSIQPTHALRYRLLISVTRRSFHKYSVDRLLPYMQILRAAAQFPPEHILPLSPNGQRLYHKRQHGIIVSIVVDS